MPQKTESSITHLDELPEEEIKHILLNCFWTITSHDTNLSVVVTCLRWTFNCELCVRVTAYPLGAPNISKQIDLDDHHPLLRASTDARNLYEAFPEPQLNSHQLEILEELMEYLHFQLKKKLNATKNWRPSNKLGLYWRRMPTCPIELSLDNYLWRRKLRIHHYKLENDFQLWFLDKSDYPSRRKPKNFDTKKH